MSDFTPNKLGFDSASCNRSIMKAADTLMGETSNILVQLFKNEIDRNGNGSKTMREDAQKVVREILHEVAEDHITIEAGFDEAMARSMATDFYVRTMVVIYGNQAGGPIWTKPGVSTWKKNVTNYGESRAKTRYQLYRFNQFDFHDKMVENVMKQIEKYFKDMLDKLCDSLTGDFFGQFITGG